MKHYSRSGIYVPRQKKAKKSNIKNNSSVDWINVFLVVLLLVVLVLFIVT